MKFSVPCGQGRLQITDTGYLELANAFGRVAWSVPAKNIGGVSSVRKTLSLTITIETPSGHHTVTTVTNQNYERLRVAIAEYQQMPLQPAQTIPSDTPQYAYAQAPTQPQALFDQSSVPPSPLSPSHNRPWYRRLRRRTWIIIVTVVLVIGAVNAIASGGSNTGTPSATPTSVAQSQSTGTPTATAKPLTVEQRAVQLAQNTAPFGKDITAKMDSSGGLTITEFLDTNGFFNNSAIIVGIKSDCFNIEKALWQAKLNNVNDIAINITATLQDQFGNNSTGSLANCDLSQQTELKFNWANLDYNTAWLDYDTQFYLPSLNNN